MSPVLGMVICVLAVLLGWGLGCGLAWLIARATRRRPTMVLRIGERDIVITDKTTAAELAKQIRKAIREQR